MVIPPYALPSVVAREHYPEWSFPKHVQRFQRVAVNLAYGATNRAIVTCPVRHGKSAFWSVVFPSWYILNHPDHLVLLCGYAADLTTTFAVQCREIIREASPRMGLELDPNWQSRASFRLRGHRGGLEAVGAGGAINGKGFHLIVPDDLVKDEQAARSPVERSSLKNWFMGDCLRRLEPGGKVVMVMSRKHPDDIVGNMLTMNPELPASKKWHEIRFQAIQQDNTALWPERYPLSELLALKRELELANKSHFWWSMYQQDPRSDPAACYFSDAELKGVPYAEMPPDTRIRRRVIACDPSLGAKSKIGDYCAVLLGSLDTKGILWLEVLYMLPAKLPDVIGNMVAFITTLKPDAAVCEAHSAQAAIALSIREKLDAAGCRVPLHPFDAGSENKEGRIILMLAEGIRRGKIRVKDTQGGRIFMSQLAEFPSGEHDDGPDAAAMLVNLLNQICG